MAILARPGLVPFAVTEVAERAPLPHVVGRAAEADLASLYAEHGARIHRFLRDLLGDATLAKDATQETFVRAYKRLSTEGFTLVGVDGQSASSVTPWLFGIARNVSLELRKARARASRYFVAGTDGTDTPAASTACPERDFLGREALRVVGTALEQLPEERRAMLLLRLDHGLSYDDIAVTMGCSLAKVKIEIFRAREVLREAMSEHRGDKS